MRFRHLSLPLALCAALVALLASASGAHAASLFGFNDDWSVSTVHRAVTLSRHFRANSERVEVYWNSTEPHRNVYNWYLLDRDYEIMLAQHVRPLFDVVSAPRWATDRRCRSIYKCQQTPAHDGDYRVFIRALTKRYPRAVGIEIGQEPNLTNWSAHPDPRRYAQILKAGWAAVKQVNRHMRVVLGSTCCNTAHGGGNIGASYFLSRLYRYGIKGHYNVIGYHIYPGREISLVAPDLRSELAGMRSVRDANRDRSRFWVTETGFPSRGVSPYGGGRFTEQNQAQREVIAYRTLRGQSDVEALYLYRLADPPRESGLVGTGMGLFKRNYRPKLSARALEQAIRGRR